MLETLQMTYIWAAALAQDGRRSSERHWLVATKETFGMWNKDEELGEDLANVFSLVSTEEAIRSSREVIEAYGDADNAIAGTIKWAEFSLDNKFVRGGFSRSGTMGSRHIANWREDDDFAYIVKHAREDGLSAGEMIPAQDGESYFWCVPYTPFDGANAPEMRIRSVLITENVFDQVFTLFNAKAELTRAERRAVFQLVTGLSLSEAASIDRVSVETKRAHSKKAISKLDCKGQAGLVRLILGQMIHVLYLCEAETSRSEIVERFTADVFGDDFRLSVQRLRSGRLLRYWEIGPEDGRPILLIHGYMFPFLLLNALSELERYNLRLVAPIRAGYLDDQRSAVAYQDDLLIEQTIEDLAQFVRLKWNGPAPVIGQALGAYYAMFLAKRAKDLFSSLTIVSINLLEDGKRSKTPVSDFIGGIVRVAGHKGLNEVITRQFHKTVFSSERSTKFVLRRLFKGTPPDLDALNGIVGSGPAFKWYQQLHAHSAIGIASDFSLASYIERNDIGQLNLPITFVHGALDPVTSLTEVQGYAKKTSGEPVKSIEGAGHFMVATHAREVWETMELVPKFDN